MPPGGAGAEASEEEFRVALEELEVSSRSLAESNLQLYNLTRTLERQVDERTADLQASLADRDALIEEIHHQTRNNLQIIASLLNLQASRISEQSAAEVRKSLGRGKDHEVWFMGWFSTSAAGPIRRHCRC